MAAVSAALPERLRGAPWAVLVAAAGAPLLLALARLLPAEGAGLALRLGAAAACVLLVPGALLLRAFAWPGSLALAAVGSLALSLAVAFAAFAVTFAVNASLTVTVALIAVVALASVVPAARVPPVEADRAEWGALVAVAAAAAVFAGLVWWSATLGTGDVLFHLARARKLAEADVLSSVGVANEFRDGGLHPGYAFPLWHGMLALVGRLAGVDATVVVLHLSAILVPFAFLVAYAAGAALFRSWVGGIAALAAQVAQLGFARGGTGSFASLALPASATRVILVPAVLALAFAFLHGGGWRSLVPLAAAALAVAVVHPTYAIFVAVALAGFGVAWLAVATPRQLHAQRLGAVLAAVLVPSGLFFLWLLPIVTSTASHTPSSGEKARALAHYGEQVQVLGETYRAAPGAITRGGAAVVAGLLVLPLLGFAARRLWAAFALGASLLILTILLVPELFIRFSDLVSLSQSRRLAQFLPIPFALAGAAVLLGRARLVGVLAAFVGGIVLQRLYPGEFTHEVEKGGPTWALWVAVIGGALALVTAVVLRGRPALVRAEPTRWAAAVALAFVLPIAVSGLAKLDPGERPDPSALTPGLVRTLRGLDPDSVVFAPVATSYRVAAFAPVYVAASPPPHVGDTDANRPYRRQRDVITFFSPGARVSDRARRRLLASYGADWLLVDKTRPYPRRLVASWPRAYEDGRYVLFEIERQ